MKLVEGAGVIQGEESRWRRMEWDIVSKAALKLRMMRMVMRAESAEEEKIIRDF